jgi:hypothetical protein
VLSINQPLSTNKHNNASHLPAPDCLPDPRAPLPSPARTASFELLPALRSAAFESRAPPPQQQKQQQISNTSTTILLLTSSSLSVQGEMKTKKTLPNLFVKPLEREI